MATVHAQITTPEEQPLGQHFGNDDEPQPVTDDEDNSDNINLGASNKTTREDWSFADASSTSCCSSSWGRASIQGSVECELIPSDTSTSSAQDTSFVAIPPPPRPLGLQNLGNTCYFNAAIQMLLSLPAFTSHLCTHDYLSNEIEDPSRGLPDYKVHIITEAGTEEFGGSTPPSTSSSITADDAEVAEQSDERRVDEEEKSKLPLVRALIDLAISLKRFGHDIATATDATASDDETTQSPSESSSVNDPPRSFSIGSCFPHRRSTGSRKSLPAHLKHSINNVVVEGSAMNPRELKNQVDEATDLFRGHRQQDAHEFLITLLDLLHEEMVKASKFPQKDGENDEGTKDSPMLVESQHTPDMNHGDLSAVADVDDNMFVVDIQEGENCETETKPVLPDSVLDCNLPDSVDDSAMDVDAEYVHISPSEAAPPDDSENTDKEMSSEEKNNPCGKAEEKVLLPTDQFHMEISVKLSCNSCTYTRSHVELYNHLSFEVNPKLTVDEALKRFFAPEQRDITCERCACKNAKQTMEILKAPRALLLHFKRFTVEYDSNWRPRVKKNLSRVDFKDFVSLCPFMADGAPVGTETLPTYKLSSVVHHIGYSANCGHYVADALHPPANHHHSITTGSLKHDESLAHARQWHRFNDSIVTPIGWKDVSGGASNSTAYMLMYELVGSSSSKLSKVKKGRRYLPKWLTRSSTR